MLDKLLEILSNIWEDLWCFNIIKQNEKGVHLRLGKVKRIHEPGLVFKAPFVDQVLKQYVNDDTIMLPSQKITTKDGKTVTLRAMVMYNVTDVLPFVLNVNMACQSIADLTAGVISEMVIKMTYQELTTNLEELNNKITKIVRRECKHWGAHVEYVKFIDVTTSRSFNIFKDSDSHL